jgi:hypothetical protein
LVEKNPLVWMADGLLVDLRDMPREVQEIAFEDGLIPYIPADRKDQSRMRWSLGMQYALCLWEAPSFCASARYSAASRNFSSPDSIARRALSCSLSTLALPPVRAQTDVRRVEKEEGSLKLGLVRLESRENPDAGIWPAWPHYQRRKAGVADRGEVLK